MDNVYIFNIFTQPETYSWLLIIVSFIISFIGIIVPVIPGILFLWLGFIAYHFLIDATDLNAFFWIVMVLFTIVILGSDFVIHYFFVDQFGGSKWSKWGAIAGVFIGIFIYPPIGMIVVPLVIVIAIELWLKKPFKHALKVALSTLAGFLSSAVAKVFIQIVMIIIFAIFILM